MNEPNAITETAATASDAAMAFRLAENDGRFACEGWTTIVAVPGCASGWSGISSSSITVRERVRFSTISGATPLPRASVTAVKTSQRPRVGQMTDRQTQRLDFAVCADGSVKMKPHDCDVTAIGPISRDQFTDDKIEMAIADLLDRLVR